MKQPAKNLDPTASLVRQMTHEVLGILDNDGQPRRFREVFATVAHHHSIFHGSQPETYNFYYRQVLRLVNRTRKKQREKGAQKERQYFREMFLRALFSGFTTNPEPDYTQNTEPATIAE